MSAKNLSLTNSQKRTQKSAEGGRASTTLLKMKKRLKWRKRVFSSSLPPSKENFVQTRTRYLERTPSNTFGGTEMRISIISLLGVKTNVADGCFPNAISARQKMVRLPPRCFMRLAETNQIGIRGRRWSEKIVLEPPHLERRASF